MSVLKTLPKKRLQHTQKSSKIPEVLYKRVPHSPHFIKQDTQTLPSPASGLPVPTMSADLFVVTLLRVLFGSHAP